MSETESQVAPENEADINKRAQEFLQGVLQRMGMQAEISVIEEDDRIILDIVSDNLEKIIGRRGQVVDALQHLVGKVVSKDRPARRGKMIVVDAGGYRAKHVERLEQLAERMSDKARQNQTLVALNPMSAHDRRIVHMKVAELAGVITRSEGTGDRRHVVIVPDDVDPSAPEPEAEAAAGE